MLYVVVINISCEMTIRRQNHCYGAECQMGYVQVKGTRKPSLFGVPKDENLEDWEKDLHRADEPSQGYKHGMPTAS